MMLAEVDFLPGYKAVPSTDPLHKLLPDPKLLVIDHVVGNQPDKEMEDVAGWCDAALTCLLRTTHVTA